MEINNLGQRRGIFGCDFSLDSSLTRKIFFEGS
jgi:hypothetical protein